MNTILFGGGKTAGNDGAWTLLTSSTLRQRATAKTIVLSPNEQGQARRENPKA